jgi:hypothetical protein
MVEDTLEEYTFNMGLVVFCLGVAILASGLANVDHATPLQEYKYPPLQS